MGGRITRLREGRAFAASGVPFAEIVETSASGIATVAADGRILYANPALRHLLGWNGVTGGMPLLADLVHPEDNAAGRHQLDRVIRGEIPTYRGEHRFAHADGSALWVLVVLTARRQMGADEPRQFILQLTDIELQKRSEAALVSSESRWSFALEGARQGVWDHNGLDDSMWYSSMWRAMRGIPPDEPVDGSKETWLSRVHPEDRERIMSRVDGQDQGVDGFDTLEYRERHRDGHYIWILSRGKPVEWDATGRAIRAIGTDSDITHLKQFEAALAAEKERWRVTLESVADGMISTDPEGRIVFMNPAASTLTGWSFAEAEGRPVEEVFAIRSATTGETQESPVATCFARLAPTADDDNTVLVARNGIQRDIRCSAAPVRMPDGSTVGAVLVFQDITQSRAMQRQLAYSASHDELTGLPNRAAFDRALSASIAAARDSYATSCLLYVDLDRFKPVNDSAGHAAGDELLRQVAQTLRGSCRSHDFIARLGGDEFAVLLSDCALPAGRRVADKIARAVAALDFTWVGKHYRIGASIGVTSIEPGRISAPGYMAEADAACYAAKAAGRGQAVVFTEIGQSPQPC